MHSMKKFAGKAAILFVLSGVLVLPREGAAGLPLCPSSQNWNNQSIKLQYIPMPGINVPDIAGDLPTNYLEIIHSGTYPIDGVLQKGLVPQSAQVPSCSGDPNFGGTGYSNGACDGKLEIRVERDGKAIANGSVTVNFLEIKQIVPQSAVTFVFANWPSCGLLPNGASAGNVPCPANASFVPFYAPIMNVVTAKRQWVNVDFMAAITVSNVTPTEIRTDTTVSTQPDEYLHLQVNPGPAIADSQWFAFAMLDNGSQAPCMQVSKVLPLFHN